MSFRKLAKINFTARMWDGPLQPLHSTSLRWTQWQDASTADPRRRLAPGGSKCLVWTSFLQTSGLYVVCWYSSRLFLSNARRILYSHEAFLDCWHRCLIAACFVSLHASVMEFHLTKMDQHGATSLLAWPCAWELGCARKILQDIMLLAWPTTSHPRFMYWKHKTHLWFLHDFLFSFHSSRYRLCEVRASHRKRRWGTNSAINFRKCCFHAAHVF